jgi:hypothetical protein
VGKLNILGSQGNTEVAWSKSDSISLDEARRRFDELVRDGFLTYKTDPTTNESEVIRRFDPAAAVITALRPIQGG